MGKQIKFKCLNCDYGEFYTNDYKKTNDGSPVGLVETTCPKCKSKIRSYK